MRRQWRRLLQEHEAVTRLGALGLVYLVERRLERLRRYRDTGRPYQTFPLPLLKAQWVDAWQVMVADLDNDARWYRLRQLECELDLRGVAPPHHLVAAERARLREHLQRLWRKSRAKPVTKAWIEAELIALRASVNPSRPFDRARAAPRRAPDSDDL